MGRGRVITAAESARQWRERLLRDEKAHRHQAALCAAEKGRHHPDTLRHQKAAKRLGRLAKKVR